MKSLWNESFKVREFPKLEGDTATDVLIIGGGMAGILCAYMLGEAGVDYMLVEGNRICSGITPNTTAKITLAHGLIYDKLIRKFGTDKAKQYLMANELALQKYKEICKEMDCDYEEKDAYVYSLDGTKKLQKEVDALKKLGYSAELVSTLKLPFKVDGAVKYKNQAEFNPMKFVSAIAPKLNIYEHTRVLELAENTAITSRGRIKAKKIIVATHFPFINKHGSYFLKMYQHRSYVIAVENAQNVEGMYVDEADKGMSFRNYKDLLLVGGGDHRTGKKGGNYDELRRFVSFYYPSSKEKYHWATQDCMTLDGVAYIGNYSAMTKDLYVATGFNKWGMSTSMVAAMILSDMVQNIENPFEKVFSPSRSILRPQLAVNGFEAVVNLLTPTKKRCTHLGCALKWNPVEHTWDCPCHGSRFTERGEVIDNPATENLK